MKFYITKETETELIESVERLKKEKSWSEYHKYNFILQNSMVLPSFKSWRKAGVITKDDREFLELDLTKNGLIIEN